MEEIQYIGEHLWPRSIGHFALLTAFVTGLLCTFAYFKSTQLREQVLRARAWRQVARASFAVHGLGVFTVMGTIFYVMINRLYEYQYAQAHVSDDLPFRYIFSAFWEGQEGSFLLWMFWHVFLGAGLIFTARKWESPVMTTLASVQVVIVSMLLGIYVGFGESLVKIGSNPLLLLRDVLDAPIFQRADYVDVISGSGLNPSLQNWWMTIHPPTLFLGFASTVVPFSFAVAGLWLKDHKGWLRPALRWSLFSATILGTGILMGGAWAYEALNFGGYWAWDPVENTSLVPWLLLLAGIHTIVVARATGHAIRASYLYLILTFVMIVYSTFLTRSGLLGDTSVHAFTEMGLEWQLAGFLGFYTLLGFGLFFWRYRSVPSPEKEESAVSKEFWLFLGSLTLLFSAILITGSTSLPVFNSIRIYFDPLVELTNKEWVLADPEAHHNQFQLWIGVFVALLSGVTQWFRWRERRFKVQSRLFSLHVGGAVIAAGLMSLLTLTWLKAGAWQYQVLLFAGWFTLITNVDYLIAFIRRDVKLVGSTLSHFGFGIMLIGILASGLNKRIISQNQFLMEGLTADEEAARTSVLLYQGLPLMMENYELELRKDTIDDFTRTFFVDYKERDAEGNVLEEFTLEPTVLYTREFDKIAITNPSTKRYWNKDIFTVIMSLAEEEQDINVKKRKEDSLQYTSYLLDQGSELSFLDTVKIKEPDTFLVRKFDVAFDGLTRAPENHDYLPEPGDIAIGAKMRIRSSMDDKWYPGEVAIVLRNESLFSFPVQFNEINTRVKIDESIFDELMVDESKLDYKKYVVREGEKITLADGREVVFRGYNRAPIHPFYAPVEEDLAVSAVLETTAPDGEPLRMEPIFVIRDKQPLRVRDEIRSLGLHATFASLNPANGEATIFLAEAAPRGPLRVPLGVATRAYRTDFIALQAIEFPGINLFWFGSIAMMVGLGFSFVYRMKHNQR